MWQPIDEEWRSVPGWSGRYQVSSLGRLRSATGIVGQWKNNQGYMLARLSRPRRVVRVHRLVASAFVPNPASKPFVNHIDCARSNNEATNLEWCTQIENLRHSANLGRMQRNYWSGRRSPNSQLSDDQVRRMREMYATGLWSWHALGRFFKVSKRCAGRAITGETYADVR